MKQKCSKCLEIKDFGLSYRDHNKKHGRERVCKKCRDAANRAYKKTEKGRLSRSCVNKRYRLSEKGKARAKVGAEIYNQSEKGKTSARAKSKKYCKKNPLVVLAHNMANRAIKSGRLIRLPCEVCGDPKSEAHHDNYNKPLDVRWLCGPHHREHHNKINHQKRSKQWLAITA